MKKALFCMAAGMLISCGTASAGGAHWGYTGHEGPEHWGTLSPAYEMCSKGRNQSPIDLKGFIEAELPPISYQDEGRWLEVVNNGHAIQVNCGKGSAITIDGKTFFLKQFHFHTPSENLVGGRSYPMEVHFVHADKDGNLAVVALMFEYGEENPIIARIWEKMPESAGKKKELEPAFSPYELLPEERDYYRFNGSLTTPPCTEGVRWFVLKKAIPVSRNQVAEFAHVMHHPNNRPVQPLNARSILK